MGLVKVVTTDAIARGQQLQSKVSDTENGFQTEIVGDEKTKFPQV